MDTYTIEYWQEHWDELITRIEEGETIGVTDGKNNAVMVPYQDYIEAVETIEECTKN
jgi:antitoxin (DNA-binding transcriptional repressor) of toxin-antitoxin stability system